MKMKIMMTFRRREFFLMGMLMLICYLQSFPEEDDSVENPNLLYNVFSFVLGISGDRIPFQQLLLILSDYQYLTYPPLPSIKKPIHIGHQKKTFQFLLMLDSRIFYRYGSSGLSSFLFQMSYEPLSVSDFMSAFISTTTSSQKWSGESYSYLPFVAFSSLHSNLMAGNQSNPNPTFILLNYHSIILYWDSMI